MFAEQKYRNEFQNTDVIIFVAVSEWGLRMILAGIDEAGLGPRLGPLATASFAMSCPKGWTPSSPWHAMRNVFSDKPVTKNNPALPVCDSKLFPSAGRMAALETTVGALYGALSPLHRGGQQVVGPSPVIAHPGHPVHPCYGDVLTPFPVHCSCEALKENAAAIRRAFDNAGARALHYAVHLLHEPAFNSVLAGGMNKNQLLLEQTGGHLVALVEKFSTCDSLYIVVDKQGGRNAYGPYLASLFPDCWPVEEESGRERSRYRLRWPDREVEVLFQAKGDRHSFCTAAASLAAKYVRERAMTNFNGWFIDRFPTLRPTAGYPLDAKRWLDEAAVLCARCGVSTPDAVRPKDNELGIELLIRNK